MSKNWISKNWMKVINMEMLKVLENIHFRKSEVLFIYLSFNSFILLWKGWGTGSLIDILEALTRAYGIPQR